MRGMGTLRTGRRFGGRALAAPPPVV